ncbi:MAG: DUF1800 family protein, partial [Gammaproteobacteria bacterium]|nr:DUF1800 family protein [Gammaproteobacteria bacterium]
TAWTQAVLYGEDQLCQRVAWALSQIFVVSRKGIPTPSHHWTTYYDNLVRGAFGNFRDLLKDVTYSAQMGMMLSHVNNSRARPAKRLFPDENYARELMQLFSLGLFELNVDGTSKLDENGSTIPSYTPEDIAELSRVMTGLSFDGEEAQFGGHRWQVDSHLPMIPFNWHHDKGEKVIVGGTVIPAGQDAPHDIEQALDSIFEHPNTGPFIARQLIQHLVTSNPEPEYVERVAEAFANDEQGTRGNMKHVIRTILTDPEAQEPANPDTFGKLKDPIIRLVSLDRMFPLKLAYPDEQSWPEGLHSYNFGSFDGAVQQIPLNAPSVFNFYSPFYSPKGDLSDNEIVTPAFQLFNMQTVIATSNFLFHSVQFNRSHSTDWHLEYHIDDEEQEILSFVPDYEDYLELADSPEDLVNRLDLVMCAGRMTANSRQLLDQRIGQIDHPEEEDERRYRRVGFAVWYITNLPEFSVEN